MTFPRLMRFASRWLFAHLFHAVILLLPTLVLPRSRGFESATICFAGGILLASLLESACVARHIRVSSHEVRDELAMRVAALVGVGLLMTFWIAQIEHMFNNDNSVAIQVLGSISLAVGVGLRVEAIRTLGTRFVSDIRVDSVVVRDGIYAWLRHPSEIGLLLIVAGGPLLLSSTTTAALATMSFLPVSVWRMRREDVALAAARPRDVARPAACPAPSSGC